jgi:uncharacterized protein
MDYVTYDKMLTREVHDMPAIQSALPEMPQDLRTKANRVLDQFRGFGKVVVAFSGGIDSTLVAHLARLALGDSAVAVTADSPSLPSSELEDAKQIALQIGIKHMIVRTEELEDPDYVNNPPNRCYFCKRELSDKLKQLASDLGIEAIVDGTNADDLKGHRPGAAALAERGVHRPLADVGLSKDEVRALAKICRLPNFDKPSMPCLSSRVQYGQIITPERLLKIEKAEVLIRSLTGVEELRVRDHGNLARIEVGRRERERFFDTKLLDQIASSLRELGFTYITLDVVGYRSGSMNEAARSSNR